MATCTDIFLASGDRLVSPSVRNRSICWRIASALLTLRIDDTKWPCQNSAMRSCIGRGL